MTQHKFSVEDANEHGIEKAILLEHLRFHQHANEGNDDMIFDGKVHAFIKPSTIKQMYPYLSYSSVRRWLNELEQEGMIESRKPKSRGGYHLTYYHVFKQSVGNSQNESSKSQNDSSYNSQNENSSNITNVNSTNNEKEGILFEKQKHPLVAYIEANYKRVSKMTEPLTDEEAVRFMKDYKKKYPDLFPTDKDLKIEIDRVLQDLNNHKAVKNNISANKTLRKFMNNHIDWHLTPDQQNKATGKGRLLSIADANNLYTENFASTNGTGIDFDKIFDHVEGQGKNKKYRVNPDHKDQIRNWNIKK